MRLFNPAADTFHAEEAIGAMKDVVTCLNRALEAMERAASHAGSADRLNDEYRNRLIEVRDEYVHAHGRLGEELGNLMETV